MNKNFDLSNFAVSIENISKRYRIGIRKQANENIFNAFNSLLKSPFRNLNNIRKLSRFNKDEEGEDIIWALKDITFDLKHEEILGIIGRNGAGKSTLLKILSRVTKPTTGKVSINGRVASLLEVGTGFHSELTGRENIYLNGTILGMKRREINNKLDEIIDFSGVEKFLDTPVKRYSSGMMVRLAFAVAAHLEPEILIIDEVLAVGDIAFQKKCLGKMKDVANRGKTVLLVSHNIHTIRSLCKRSILLEGGKIVYDGTTEKTINQYLGFVMTNFNESTGIKDRKNRTTGAVRFTNVSFHDGADNAIAWSIKVGNTLKIKLCLKVFEKVPDLGIFMTFRSMESGEVLTSLKHLIIDKEIYPGETFSVGLEIPDLILRPGEYLLLFWLGNKEYSVPYDIIDDNVNLRPLIITSDSVDPLLSLGYFSIPSKAYII